MGLPAQPETEADVIAERYLAQAGGNPSAALRLAIRDALADLCELERSSLARDRLVSHGYARAKPVRR